MILPMSRVRIMGPRGRLNDVLSALQDLGLLHLSAPESVAPLETVPLDAQQLRGREYLRQALADVDHAIEALGITRRAPEANSAPPQAAHPAASTAELAQWARLAWQTRRAAERLAIRRTEIDEERALILKYQHFFAAFRALLESEQRWPNAVAYHVLVKKGDAGTIPALRASLASVIGGEFEIYTQQLPSGETALLIVVSGQAAQKVERLLADAQVQEIPVPKRFGGGTLAEAIPRMLARLGEIPGELEHLEAERTRLAAEHRDELLAARDGLDDRLRALMAIPFSGVTPRAFVIEGWVPSRARTTLDKGLHDRCGDDIVVSEIAREEWSSDAAPVVLSNPRLLQPFETLIRLLPLPRYGSIDPTPFVAVFFPAFFGLMVGDIGYGIVLAVIGLILHARTRPGTLWRNVAEIAGPCALFTIVAGFLYGEFFGDLGTRWFGLRPLLFSREDAIIPFLLLAVSLGVVHVLLALILGAIGARHHPREAIGRGISALMVVLVVLALLAAVKVLPDRLFTPSVIALLIAFPLLIAVEGLVAMIELLSTLGNILSYTRIMALGVASVMLAVVANRMVGAVGSVAVGIVFALLFHLVNFGIAMFSPTIHALRLHYVEFFGKFYSPGGVQFQPLSRWHRGTEPPPSPSPSPTRQHA
jgi:V/A-type H+/Na+-transporting ATPase subunit I